MTKIYAVEVGDYSDYRVEGVFSTKENAEMYFAALPESRWNIPNIAEWELDAHVDKLILGMKMFWVRMDKDGNSVVNLTTPEESLCNDQFIDRGIMAGQLLCYVWATDHAHAAKIANERRVQYIASGEWK